MGAIIDKLNEIISSNRERLARIETNQEVMKEWLKNTDNSIKELSSYVNDEITLMNIRVKELEEQRIEWTVWKKIGAVILGGIFLCGIGLVFDYISKSLGC